MKRVSRVFCNTTFSLFKSANNKGADLHRLVCTFVVCMQQNLVSHSEAYIIKPSISGYVLTFNLSDRFVLNPHLVV